MMVATCFVGSNTKYFYQTWSFYSILLSLEI